MRVDETKPFIDINEIDNHPVFLVVQHNCNNGTNCTVIVKYNDISQQDVFPVGIIEERFIEFFDFRDPFRW